MVSERKLWPTDLAAGPVVGIAIGLIEYMVHTVRGVPLLLPSLLPGMLLLYLLFWSIAGIGVTLLFLLLRQVFKGAWRDPRNGPALLAAAAIAFTVYSAACAHFFVDIRRPWTILLGTGTILLILALTPLIRSVIPARAVRRPGRLLAGAFLILLLAFPLRFLPERGTKGEAAVSGKETRGPNILLVVFDTLRFDHTGVHGYHLSTTPNIDRIASEGVLFERAYAPSSWTLPSTASILTSRYPSGHGVINRASALPPEAYTLPALLREGGYRTGLFSGNPFVEPNFGFGNGFTYLLTPSTPLYMKIFYLPYYLKKTLGRWRISEDTDRLVTAYETLWRPHLDKEWIEADLLVDGLLRWISDGKDGPFFAHVQIMEPHDPYVGEGKFGARGVTEAPHVGIAPVHPFDTVTEPSAEAKAEMIGRYDDDIWKGDLALGTLVDSLEARGILEDCWVVITSDHGEEFWDHNGWGHGNSLFEELIRVPLIFRGKGIVPCVVPSMARLIDIAPTVTEAAGMEIPDRFSGRSLLPVLFGLEMDTGIYENFAELNRATGRSVISLMRADGTKVIYARSGPDESLMYFDLSTDAGEKRDLLEEDDTLADALLRELLSAAEDAAEGLGDAAKATIDPVTERRLRALGYVD